MGDSVDVCSSCGKKISGSEKAYVVDGRLVCVKCDEKLSGSKQELVSEKAADSAQESEQRIKKNPRLQKILVSLGFSFLVLIFIITGGIVYVTIEGTRLDKESKEYADTAIVAIVSSWDKEELIERASPGLMAAVEKNDLDKIFGFYQKLGKLKEYKGSDGESHISIIFGRGKTITAGYLANAEFEEGSAKITTTLVKHGTNWQILKFYVDSNVFFEQD